MAETQFYKNPKLKNQAYILIIIGIVFTLLTGIIYPLFMTVSGVIILVIPESPFFIFEDDYIEIKLAPLRSSDFIKHDELESVSKDGKFLVLEVNNGTKPIKVPLIMFRDEEQWIAFSKLQSIVGNC